MLVFSMGASGDTPGRTGQWWRSLLAILGVWAVVSLISASQYYAMAMLENRPVRFVSSLWVAAVLWISWVVAAPLVLILARSIPVSSPARLTKMFLHLVLSAVFGLGHIAFTSFANVYIFHFPRTNPQSFGTAFVRSIPPYLLTEIIVYWAILGAAIAIDAQRRWREKELRAAQLETQLSQSLLQNLQMQIQPHFLYNSLNTIAMMARSGENSQAVDMIAQLGELLRSSLARDASQKVPLASEIDFVERYLQIEQYRFGERLNVTVDVPSNLVTVPVPQFIVQPLVENAVRHGVAQTSDPVKVCLTVREVGADLRFDICDDGPGLRPGWNWDRDSGMGLRNVRSRLELLYGPAGRLSIEGNHPHGTIARLHIPYCQAVGESDLL